MGFLSSIGLGSVGGAFSFGRSGSSGLTSFLGGQGASWSDLTPGGVLDDLTGRRNMREQNEWNYRMWQEQNAYNTPAEQMKRFDAAGLNPNLIYSQGNAGNATGYPTSASAGGLSQALGSVSSTFQAVMAAKNLIAQNKNINAQNSLIDSQTDVAKQQANKQMLENAYFKKYGQWPAQESGFVRGTKSLVNYVPELYFNLVDVLDDVLSKDTFTRGRMVPRGDNGGR